MKSNNCQVAFYVLADAEQSAEHLACRLAMKAWEQGFHVVVLAADEDEAISLDRTMWNIPAGRLLPHSRGPADAHTHVSIDVHGAEIPDGRDLVINLADQPVSEPGRFRRLLEIVPCADQRRRASRQKFRIYRDLGLEPETHNLDQAV
jgi:DNA polymerase-3 subunit chi